jgi:hypothetical protein
MSAELGCKTPTYCRTMDSKTKGVNIRRENVPTDPRNHQKQIHAYMEI